MSMPCACSMERVFVVSDPSARPYLTLTGLTRKIQCSVESSKLRQVRNRDANQCRIARSSLFFEKA